MLICKPQRTKRRGGEIYTKNNLIRDLGIIALSVLIAVILVKTGIIQDVLIFAKEFKMAGSLVAGAFFVSVFTAAPAMVVLAELAQANSVFEVAFFGGLGALLGDWIIFRFIRNGLAEDFLYLLKMTKTERLAAIFKLRPVRWLVSLAGALIVASPLPDEVGLMLMGLSKMKLILFIPLSFMLNFLGILAVAFVAQAL